MTWTSTQWSALGAVVQAAAALVSLIVIWVYTAKSNNTIIRQQKFAEEQSSRELERSQAMEKKVASVLARRLGKIHAALDGIATLKSSMMFVMDPVDKGLPDDLIVLYLSSEITYRVFSLFDQLRDDHANVTGVFEEHSDPYTLKTFCDVATVRRDAVNGLIVDLRAIVTS